VLTTGGAIACASWMGRAGEKEKGVQTEDVPREL